MNVVFDAAKVGAVGASDVLLLRDVPVRSQHVRAYRAAPAARSGPARTRGWLVPNKLHAEQILAFYLQ